MTPEQFLYHEAHLLDMQRYNKLLAGASWMGEYGNPDDPKDWEFISKYSPYQNVFKDPIFIRAIRRCGPAWT